MAYDLDKLRKEYEDAEAKAQKLQADRDEAIAKVRDRYDGKLRAATDAAAAAQKEWRDAEAFVPLLDRPDGESVARGHVEQGGMTQETFDELFPAQ
jgi:hypothetical protein